MSAIESHYHDPQGSRQLIIKVTRYVVLRYVDSDTNYRLSTMYAPKHLHFNDDNVPIPFVQR